MIKYFTRFFNKEKIFCPFSFQQQLEEAVDLRCITHGSLKTSRSQFNPESGEIEFSLKVEDPEWQPKLGLKKWDPEIRTFTEVSFFFERISISHIAIFFSFISTLIWVSFS